MTKDIFITGSSGVLGFEALQHLNDMGLWTAHGVARRPLPARKADLKNIEVETVFDANWLPNDAKDPTIVHFAGLANPRVQFNGYVDMSIREITPHIEMVEDMLARGWRGHLVYISSGGAIYGDVDCLPIPESQAPRPKGYYALQKISVENALVFLANQYDFQLTILRVSNPYGSQVPKKGQGVIPILLDAAMNANPFTVIGTGEEMRDYLHISDFRNAIGKACATPPKGRINTINIGSGVGTSLNALLGLAMRLTGKQIDAKCAETTFDVKSNILDIRRAKALLDWEPKIGIEEGIAMMVADYRALNTESNVRSINSFRRFGS
ncbi:NAD-dependent epimerase/dehydratase family protein [Sulfitobacter sp.]|uniref:NAD-dependent epimerase/dehydratase family protein n=1 Tax=Sulfitobacter sp. TaxID=1903071 RepID=UPI0040591E34